MQTLLLLAIGLIAGVLSGMFGIGGCVVIVPALLYLLKMKPVEAFATSLAALVLPVGILGAVEYYQRGEIHMRTALLIAGGMFLGAYFGAKLTLNVPPDMLRRAYGLLLLVVSIRMVFFGR